ncbi:MAG: hypothetical protein CMM07_05255 [Rhodopirellula sp.]|nr:hypothetical protein [Rhodopirellula sp.]
MTGLNEGQTFAEGHYGGSTGFSVSASVLASPAGSGFASRKGHAFPVAMDGYCMRPCHDFIVFLISILCVILILCVI